MCANVSLSYKYVDSFSNSISVCVCMVMQRVKACLHCSAEELEQSGAVIRMLGHLFHKGGQVRVRVRLGLGLVFI